MKDNPIRLETKIHRSMGEICREEWEAVFPDKVRSYQFFKSIDTAGFKGFSHYYIMVYNKGRLVGIAPCFLFNYPLETTLDGLSKAVLRAARGMFPALFNFRTLMCGIPESEGRIGIDDAHPGEVLRAVLASMEKIARNERAAIIAFKDFTSEYSGILDGLRRYNFHKVESYPSVELDIQFSSFDEYMRGLSHATRKDLKRKFRKLEGLAKVECEVADSAHHILDEVYGLYRQTFSRSEVQFEEATKDFFRNISVCMPGRSKYFLWRIGGKLVAFNLCLACEDTLVDEYIGLDYAAAHDYHLYFLTFRDVINWCIANGIKKYRSGAMTYEPKKRLKCSFVPCYTYLRHTNAFINPFFSLVSAALKPENFDRTLKEMKKRRLGTG